jgi:hypothetical protein
VPVIKDGPEGSAMSVNRDQFFAQLDGLTEREIEERLPSWDMERLVLVQEYVERKGLVRAEAAQPDQAEVVRDTLLAAIHTARRANARALAALILSVGAMLAAIVCGVIVILR